MHFVVIAKDYELIAYEFKANYFINLKFSEL